MTAIEWQDNSDFVQWMATHGKSYSTMAEFFDRQAVYKRNSDQIRQAVESGLVRSSTLGHNRFSDRLPGEVGASRPQLFAELNSSPVLESTSLLADGYKEIVNYCSN